jgi:hypothetical protein
VSGDDNRLEDARLAREMSQQRTLPPAPPSRTNPKAAKLLGLEEASDSSTAAGGATAAAARKLAPAGSGAAAAGAGAVATPRLTMNVGGAAAAAAAPQSMFAAEKPDKKFENYTLPPTPKKALDQHKTTNRTTDLKTMMETPSKGGTSPNTRMPPPSPRLVHQMSDFALPAAANSANAAGAAASAASAWMEDEPKQYFTGDRYMK